MGPKGPGHLGLSVEGDEGGECDTSYGDSVVLVALGCMGGGVPFRVPLHEVEGTTGMATFQEVLVANRERVVRREGRWAPLLGCLLTKACRRQK
jgi:hypothetical protein